MSECRHLEEAHFNGPCTIDIDTLYKSEGRIPESFLRGAGVPKPLINYVVQAAPETQYYSCFISNSHKDEKFAQRLHGRLQQEQLRVWIAAKDMRAGRKIHEQIQEAIGAHDKLLLILSEHNMNSEWVKTEIAHARKREKEEVGQILFPIGLVTFDRIRDWTAFDADSGKDMAREIREYLIADFSHWEDQGSFEEGFAKLLAALKAE